MRQETAIGILARLKRRFAPVVEENTKHFLKDGLTHLLHGFRNK